MNSLSWRPRIAAAFSGCGLFIAATVQASPAPEFGRYMPLYPGQYLDLSYSHDPGDRAFNADGDEMDSSLRFVAGRSAFGRDALTARMSWHFPLLESYQIPFVSSRTWFGRISFSHARTQTSGALTSFIADTSDDANTDADDLRNNGSGLGDMRFELGTYLFGSPTANWRTRERSPLALLAALGFRANFGEYDRNAPVNAGSNSPAAHLQLGLHWQPWAGGFVDAGLRQEAYFKNQDPAFGALAPAQPGDARLWDLSLGQKLVTGVYLTVFAQGFDAEPNRYSDVRFTTNPPPGADPIGDRYPTPGDSFDAGTMQREIGLGLSWFATQRLRIALHYTQPLAGRSGEVELGYTQRLPAGCFTDAAGCIQVPFGSTVTDGYGPARVFASDRIALSLSFNFLERDTFDCVGCTR